MYITVIPVSTIAGGDRGLDRRGAAPARQERSVKVQTSETGNLEHRAWQDLTVSHHHDHVRFERTNLLDRVRILDFRWAAKSASCCSAQCGLDRRRGDLLFAADRFVRLGNDSDKFVLGVLERAQCRHADFASADEDNAHGSASPTQAT